MSKLTNRPFDLDAALEGWLRESPRLSADRVVASALTDVGTTPQVRGSLFAVDATVLRVGLIAAVVAALAIGLGLGLRPRLIGTDASPAPSIGPAPSDESPSLIPYTNPALGYELLLPQAWVASAEPMSDNRAGVPPGSSVPGVVRFGDSAVSLQPALLISVGTAEGEVFICELGICMPDTVASLGGLDAAVASVPTSALGSPRLTTSEVVVDGEPGRIESPVSATCDDTGCYFSTGSGTSWLPGRPLVQRTVVFLHDGRPFVLAFDYFSASLEEVRAIVESFRFLTQETPEASAPTGYTGFGNPVDGYELTMPSTWDEVDMYPIHVEPSGPVEPPGTVRLQPDVLVEGLPRGLSISVGSPAGVVYLCDTVVCRQVTADTLGELEAEIKARWPNRFNLMGRELVEHIGDTELGGEPARLRYPAPDNTPGGLGFGSGWAIGSIYAIHDGRPVVMTFEIESWVGGQPEVLSTYTTIFRSFRWLD